MSEKSLEKFTECEHKSGGVFSFSSKLRCIHCNFREQLRLNDLLKEEIFKLKGEKFQIRKTTLEFYKSMMKYTSKESS